MDPSALSTGSLTGLLAAALAAIAYLFREIRTQEREHRATLEKIIPIAEKLADSIEIVERLQDARRGNNV